MKCAQYKELFSPYLDGHVSGAEMFALTEHIKQCPGCAQEYAEVQRTLQLLVQVNKARLNQTKAPADLPLRLRLAISRESKQARRRRFEGAMVRLSNALNAIMVPATAGVVSAVLTFGLLLGFFALPQQLQASSSDVPLMLYTGPQLEQSVFGTSLGTMGDDSVVIEAFVDANGRVEDYRILSQPDDAKDVVPQVKNLLIFTTFRPALSMGRPTAGRAVISFSKISVKG
jgi:predicted anti-sigma-YlaC factor YlaD